MRAEHKSHKAQRIDLKGHQMHGRLLCQLYKAGVGGHNGVMRLSPINETITGHLIHGLHTCAAPRVSDAAQVYPRRLQVSYRSLLVSCLGSIKPHVFPVKPQAQSLLVSMCYCAAAE